MTNLENRQNDHARPSKDALDPVVPGPNTPSRRMQELANESASRSSERIKRNEAGKGVVPETDGH